MATGSTAPPGVKNVLNVRNVVPIPMSKATR